MSVSSDICGGLGNQLFIVATTIAYALDHGKEPIFVKINKSPSYGKPRPVYWNNILKKIKTIDKLDKRFKLYKEKYFTFSELPSIDGNVILKGYFQSWKYFDHHKYTIIKLFKDSNQINNYVSIHVRRGDYLKLKHIYNQLDMDYYKAAMAFFPGRNFMVFSDDINWCKKNFIGKQFTFVEGKQDHEELILMSDCTDNIISNSTFSWWAAYLNNNPGKCVVTPKKFFVNKLSSEDMIPYDWVQI